MPVNKRRLTLRLETYNEQGEKIIEHIRQQARKAREEKQISQRELSLTVNRSKSFISKMEAGDLVPSVTDLLAMSLTLKKPLKYFLPGFAYYKPTDDELDGDEWELVRAYRKIKNDEAKKLAIKSVEGLSQIK